MRWFHYEPTDPTETAQHDKILQQIDAWWQQFASRTGDLNDVFAQRKQWDLPQWMHDHLQVIDERLMWEFGPGLHGGHRLVITPEAAHHLRPLVRTILDRAPAIAGWEFYPYRLPEKFEQ